MAHDAIGYGAKLGANMSDNDGHGRAPPGAENSPATCLTTVAENKFAILDPVAQRSAWRGVRGATRL